MWAWTKRNLIRVIGCLACIQYAVCRAFYRNGFYQQFKFDLKQHLEVIVIGIVMVTTAPVIVKLFFGKKSAAIIQILRQTNRINFPNQN